ncbi:MAG: hypothetical protein QOI89_538 [Solirubrobacteraceae bacterium]|jgi:hypothetical protein|nr:hypothetical protein [Solirubrobacteraceae bacterium]
MRAGGFWINGAVAACTLCCVLASAQAASALEPGVHVDPGSPAAKEYALPLDQARQTGSESSSQPTSEGGLFGAGIKPPGSGGSRGGGGGGTGGGTGGSATGGHGANATGHAAPPAQGASATSPSQAQLAQAALRAAREQGSGGGNGSILALVGGGVAILVLGGFGGTVLRHSRRPRPTA